MAVTETLSSIKGVMLLNDGIGPSGNIKTVTQSIGTLGLDWDAQKAANIANAMEGVLTKSIYAIQGVKTFNIMES